MIRKEFNFKTAIKKVVLITAGLHGNEHTSVYAIDEFIHNLQIGAYKPKNVSKIIIYNYINLDGILERERLCNNLDLNREFSEIISSNNDIEQIKKDALISDIIIDVHSSFNSTQFFFIDKDKYTSSYALFLSANHLNYVISPDPNKNTLKYFINKKSNNKCGFTLELNQNGNNIDIASGLRGIHAIQTLINHIDAFYKKPSTLLDFEPAITLTADISGLLKINDILGKNIHKGDKLGYILSLDKNRMINIIAPCDGKIIVYPAFMTYISVNTPILTIQPN